MGKNTPRKANVSITYKPSGGSKISAADMHEMLETFQYVDCATGESDTATLVISNIDMSWAGEKLPRKGDKFSAKIRTFSWDKLGSDKVFSCGTFCCDDRDFDFPNDLTVTINGTSVPEKQAFRSTKRKKTWKNVTFREIARQIAGRYGLQLFYDAPQIQIKTVSQESKEDCSFLKELCDDYGLYIKIYNGKIVIYNPTKYERKPPVRTFNFKDIKNGHANSTISGTYTGAEIKYTKAVNGKEKKEFTCKIGGGNRILSINEKCESLDEAQRKAKAKLAEENRKAETISLDVFPVPGLTAANCIRLKGAKELSGKYFIDKITHKIDGDSGGYSMQLEVHKVQPKTD